MRSTFLVSLGFKIGRHKPLSVYKYFYKPTAHRRDLNVCQSELEHYGFDIVRREFISRRHNPLELKLRQQSLGSAQGRRLEYSRCEYVNENPFVPCTDKIFRAGDRILPGCGLQGLSSS
jgi:hypothetical protein